MIRRLIDVWSLGSQHSMTIGVSILAGLHCLIVENGFLFHFVHKMTGARNSACPPGKIELRKLWKCVSYLKIIITTWKCGSELG